MTTKQVQPTVQVRDLWLVHTGVEVAVDNLSPSTATSMPVWTGLINTINGFFHVAAGSRHPLESPRGEQKVAAAPPTGPGLDSEIRANPMRSVNT